MMLSGFSFILMRKKGYRKKRLNRACLTVT